MRMVLLRHELPDGSAHFDWMIQRGPTPDAHGLITFRVSVRIDHPQITQFEAVRIGDHREAYLDYQGPLSNDRGHVTRIESGTATRVTDLGSTLHIQGTLGSATGQWTGRESVGGWQFVRTATEP